MIETPVTSFVKTRLARLIFNQKGMLHQGLKVKKKLDTFFNLKSVVSDLCRISL